MSQPGFLERSIAGISSALEHALYSEELARRPGLLQRIDSRAKVAGMMALVVSAAVSHRLAVILCIAAIALILALLSQIPVGELMRRVWLSVLAFTAVIAIPAIFLTPGEVLYRLPVLHWPITNHGLRTAVLLIARVETASTITVLLVLCTPWTRVLRSLRAFRVPREAVVILGMTHRYVFLLLESAREMFESRRSRVVGVLGSRERRHIAAGTAGVLLQRTLELSNDVHLAMTARGYRGNVYLLEEEKMRFYDFVFLASLLAISAAAIWLGR